MRAVDDDSSKFQGSPYAHVLSPMPAPLWHCHWVFAQFEMVTPIVRKVSSPVLWYAGTVMPVPPQKTEPTFSTTFFISEGAYVSSNTSSWTLAEHLGSIQRMLSSKTWDTSAWRNIVAHTRTAVGKLKNWLRMQEWLFSRLWFCRTWRAFSLLRSPQETPSCWRKLRRPEMW